MILYSLMTDDEPGVAGVIGMPTHLAMDAAGGLLLAASPWIFGFAQAIWAPHLILELLEAGTAVLTRTVPAHGPGRAGTGTASAA